uniref:Uncharacterized protein n=1 Tax=Trichogramma kaykai TaxID=54128 RepID=A0ABD2XJK3_9HYME
MQVSSSEYFSVSFEVGDEQSSIDREEFLPATKGAYLARAISCSATPITRIRRTVYCPTEAIHTFENNIHTTGHIERGLRAQGHRFVTGRRAARHLLGAAISSHDRNFLPGRQTSTYNW